MSSESINSSPDGGSFGAGIGSTPSTLDRRRVGAQPRFASRHTPESPMPLVFPEPLVTLDRCDKLSPKSSSSCTSPEHAVVYVAVQSPVPTSSVGGRMSQRAKRAAHDIFRALVDPSPAEETAEQICIACQVKVLTLCAFSTVMAAVGIGYMLYDGGEPSLRVFDLVCFVHRYLDDRTIVPQRDAHDAQSNIVRLVVLLCMLGFLLMGIFGWVAAWLPSKGMLVFLAVWSALAFMAKFLLALVSILIVIEMSATLAISDAVVVWCESQREADNPSLLACNEWGRQTRENAAITSCVLVVDAVFLVWYSMQLRLHLRFWDTLPPKVLPRVIPASWRLFQKLRVRHNSPASPATSAVRLSDAHSGAAPAGPSQLDGVELDLPLPRFGAFEAPAACCSEKATGGACHCAQTPRTPRSDETSAVIAMTPLGAHIIGADAARELECRASPHVADAMPTTSLIPLIIPGPDNSDEASLGLPASVPS